MIGFDLTDEPQLLDETVREWADRDVAPHVQQASCLSWRRAGWMKNEDRRNTRKTGLAKRDASVASERAAGDAVQIHGATGYSSESPLGHVDRNCKGDLSHEGTRAIHTLMQADNLLRYRVDRPTRCELPAASR